MNRYRALMLKLILVLLPLLLSAQSTPSVTYAIKNLKINDSQSNFGVSYYGNTKVVYSSPTNRRSFFKSIWKPNGQPYLDLFEAEIDVDSGELINSKPFSKKINSRYHEGGQVCFNLAGDRVYFTRSNYYKGKYIKSKKGINKLQLFTAMVDGRGDWHHIKKLPFNDDEYSYGHPALSEDGKTLYFVSDMPGGFGRTDLYKVSIGEDDTYSVPENLGSEVNTLGREMFPYVSGNDLYFSTDSRKGGYGNLDIYKIKIREGFTESSVNLGNTINSNRDDFAFVINRVTRTGYFSSNRKGGKGDDDIYYFEELKKPLPKAEKPLPIKCIQYYTLELRDSETRALIKDSYISIVDSDGRSLVSRAKTDGGVYEYDLKCEASYRVVGYSKYYKSSEKKVLVDSLNQKATSVGLFLQAQFVEKRGKVLANINNIYFDYDESFIREDAAIELNKVVELMKQYPNINIEAGSHTDSRGRESYNQKLSYRRAKSVVNFIVSKGISPTRITSNGYGESQILNGCTDGVKCTEEEHSVNRRTEFVILNPEYIK